MVGDWQDWDGTGRQYRQNASSVLVHNTSSIRFPVRQIPRITIVAMKEHGGEGAYANGPMLRAIYDTIFTQVIKDVPRSPAPDQNFCGNTGLLQPRP